MGRVDGSRYRFQNFPRQWRPLSSIARVSKLQVFLVMLVVMLVFVQSSLLQVLQAQRPPVDQAAMLSPQSLLLHDEKKYSNSNSTAASIPNYSLGPYCLVHVGKTAGGTISCRVGSWLAKNCKKPTRTSHHHLQPPQSQRPPSSSSSSSVLGKHVLGKIHKNRDWGCMKRNGRQRPELPAVWLFTLRHPLDRIVSWFHYEHLHLNHISETVSNRPALYDDCFDDMNDLAQIGLNQAWGYKHDINTNSNSNSNTNPETLSERESDPNMSPKCAKRAWNAITGKVGYEYHNFYNYRYYKDWVDHVMGPTTNYTILVIRSEHLEEDWGGLEELYNNHKQKGGSTNRTIGVNKGKQQDDYFATVQRHKSNSSSLSPDSYLNLCRALCQEIQIYSYLLKRAINLTPQQLEQSMDELHAKCPPPIIMKCDENPPILQFHDDVRVVGTPDFPRK
jgi:hypothetical protein